MPAVSKRQQIATAIAEHHPEELYARNKGLAKMSAKSLHDFAATPAKDLPEKKRGYGAEKRSHHGRRAKPRG